MGVSRLINAHMAPELPEMNGRILRELGYFMSMSVSEGWEENLENYTWMAELNLGLWLCWHHFIGRYAMVNCELIKTAAYRAIWPAKT